MKFQTILALCALVTMSASFGCAQPQMSQQKPQTMAAATQGAEAPAPSEPAPGDDLLYSSAE